VQAPVNRAFETFKTHEVRSVQQKWPINYAITHPTGRKRDTHTGRYREMDRERQRERERERERGSQREEAHIERGGG